MLVSIIGEPASGKTTLMKEIIAKTENWQHLKYKKLRMMMNKKRKVFIFGIYGSEGIFQGTDLLSMAVQPDAIEFVRKYSSKYPDAVFLTEGDRLNNQKFYNAIKDLKIKHKIFCLSVDPEIKRLRHIQRNDTQSDRFKQAIKTKITNIKANNKVTELNNGNLDMMHDNIEVILKSFGWKDFTKVK